MQYISAKPLIREFQHGTFDESEVGPYFVVDTLLTAFVLHLGSTATGPITIVSGIVSVLVTLFGIYYLKAINQGTFGNQFLAKFFCLGWVASVRLMLLTLPVLLAFSALLTATGYREFLHPLMEIFFLIIEVFFYFSLGTMFSRCQQPSVD